MKARRFSTRTLAVVTVIALLIMCVSFTATAAPASQVGRVPTITPELINKLRESVVVYDYRTELPSASSGISPYATRSVTIPAGGTVAISTDTYGVGETLYINVLSNSGNALLFFYLMNSGGDIVGPKTLPSDENMFVLPTGSCSMTPPSGTYTFYINNDSDRSTTIRMTYFIL